MLNTIIFKINKKKIIIRSYVHNIEIIVMNIINNQGAKYFGYCVKKNYLINGFNKKS